MSQETKHNINFLSEPRMACKEGVMRFRNLIPNVQMISNGTKTSLMSLPFQCSISLTSLLFLVALVGSFSSGFSLSRCLIFINRRGIKVINYIIITIPFFLFILLHISIIHLIGFFHLIILL